MKIFLQLFFYTFLCHSLWADEYQGITEWPQNSPTRDSNAISANDAPDSAVPFITSTPPEPHAENPALEENFDNEHCSFCKKACLHFPFGWFLCCCCCMDENGRSRVIKKFFEGCEGRNEAPDRSDIICDQLCEYCTCGLLSMCCLMAASNCPL